MKSLRRHLDSTREFKDALMLANDGGELLENLHLDVLFNSPNLASRELAIEVAASFLKDPNFPQEKTFALTRSA